MKAKRNNNKLISIQFVENYNLRIFVKFQKVDRVVH